MPTSTNYLTPIWTKGGKNSEGNAKAKKNMFLIQTCLKVFSLWPYSSVICEIKQNTSLPHPPSENLHGQYMNIYIKQDRHIWTHQEEEGALAVNSSDGKVHDHIQRQVMHWCFSRTRLHQNKTLFPYISPEKYKCPILNFVSSELCIFKSKISF